MITIEDIIQVLSEKNVPMEKLEEVRKSYEVINFLNSLPEIESHLCRGGYIQDRNGTPCCHGDKVMFKIFDCESLKHLIEIYGSITNGILEWNPDMRAFIITFGDGDWLDFTCSNDGVQWFEKVEE